MNRRNFWAFMGVLALIFALALGSIGCGGSSSGPIGGGGGGLTLSGHYILIGTLNQASELTPYVNNIITDRLTVSDIQNLDDPLSVNFSSRDIIFIADARNLSADNATTNAFVYNALGLSGATIAAVYPNADDVNNLENMLGIHFASPNDEPVDKHYEFIAVGRRYISSDADYLVYNEGDITYDFVYVERSSKNESYFDASIESFDVYNPNPTYSDDAGVADLDDSLPTNTETDNTEEAQQEIISEQEANEALAQRVNELIIWSEGLNVLAGEVADEVIRTASAFAVNVAAETKQAPDEIRKLVSGTHTSISDNFDESFGDYDDRVIAGASDSGWKRKVVRGDWQTFRWDKCGFDRGKSGGRSHFNQYWKDFKVSRLTSGKHMTYGFHAFQNNSDYYLITNSVNTQPQNLQIRAAYGPYATGKDLEYSLTYHSAVIVGCTRGLTLQIWPGNYKGVANIKVIPSLTVNRTHSYSDTDGWSIGGDVSFSPSGGKGKMTMPGEGAQGGQGGQGPITSPYSGWQLGGSVSFNAGISHQSTRQWSASDYELIPKPYVKNNSIPVAKWDIEVLAPYYTGGGGWKEFPTAARSSVTLEVESMWKVSPDVAYTFDFTTRTDWKNGFMWARDYGSVLGAKRYDCTVEHIGNEGKLNFTRPPHATMTDVVTSGTSEGNMYTAKIYTEDSWTAESNASWLKPLQTSGGVSNGDNFSYTVEPNYTGMSRRGTITITSGRDKLYLVFDQSAYSPYSPY